MIRDPYVRLFLPYDARRDNARLRKACPDLQPFRGEGFSSDLGNQGTLSPALARQLLQCWSRLETVTLDGRPLTLDPLFYIDPGSGLHGRLAMIPISGLPPGRHQLVIRRIQIGGAEDKRGTKEYTIPFWK